MIIIYNHLSPEKSGCDSSSDSVMAFQGTVVNKKFHVLRAIKIISIILSLRIVIRSAMKAGFTMKFCYTGRDY